MSTHFKSADQTWGNPTFTPLIQQLVDGQSLAWHQFLNQYNPMILNWLRNWGVNPNDIDDVKQEITSFVFRKLPGFVHNGQKGAFRSWLKQVTYNRLREARRTRRQFRFAGSLPLSLELVDSVNELSQRYNQQHLDHLLETCLSRLSRQFQEKSLQIFRETVLRGRSIRQVSQDLSVSEGAARVAKSRVQRAFIILMREFAGQADSQCLDE